MGLYTIIKKIKRKEKEISGLDNAGKTTIVKKLCDEDIHQISPTFGFNIKTLFYKNYVLNIWDVGGQKSLRSYWKNYFESTEGLIWVVDSSDVRRLIDCKQELHKQRLEGATLLIFANKQDLQGAKSENEISEILELRLIKGHHYQIYPCSAVTGDNLEEGMDWLLKDISTRIF